MGRKRYETQLVDVRLVDERRSSWKWGRSIQGTEYRYEVCDRNFDRLNRWEFVVSVPNRIGQVVVRPALVPGKSAFADLERRVVVFTKATKNPHRRFLYCKLNVADATGDRNRISMRRGERDLLPRWFDYFRPIMRIKDTVTTTKGTDGATQVCIVSPADHERMIRLFFALRVWVLQERIEIK
ncbi:MAG: hypothetical protein IMZ50_01795 [Candidatus Atribacteria bacterium]|nr:hypothetical protein [Candidatus Atribacteria bacterium]